MTTAPPENSTVRFAVAPAREIAASTVKPRSRSSRYRCTMKSE